MASNERSDGRIPGNNQEGQKPSCKGRKTGWFLMREVTAVYRGNTQEGQKPSFADAQGGLLLKPPTHSITDV